jgi:hypothetical protein
METGSGDFTCRTCGSRTGINVPVYLMKPRKVETKCFSRNSFSVKYTGGKPFPFNYSLCEKCLGATKKSQGRGDLILFSGALALTVILFFVLPSFKIIVLVIGGFLSLALLMRLSDSFGSGAKYLKKHIGRENVFSTLHFKLDDGTEAQSFHFKTKDMYPAIGGGGTTYSDFKDNAYLVFTDEHISHERFEILIAGQEKTIGNMTFEFNG